MEAVAVNGGIRAPPISWAILFFGYTTTGGVVSSATQDHLRISLWRYKAVRDRWQGSRFPNGFARRRYRSFNWAAWGPPCPMRVGPDQGHRQMPVERACRCRFFFIAKGSRSRGILPNWPIASRAAAAFGGPSVRLAAGFGVELAAYLVIAGIERRLHSLVAPLLKALIAATSAARSMPAGSSRYRWSPENDESVPLTLTNHWRRSADQPGYRRSLLGAAGLEGQWPDARRRH